MDTTIRRRIGIALVAGIVGVTGTIAVAALAGADREHPVEPARIDEGIALEAARDVAFAEGDAYQQQAFEDGLITPDEYGGAIERVVDCLVASGFELSDVGVDWSGLTYEYGVLGGDGLEDDYQACYRKHGAGVDMAHQLLHEDDRFALLAEIRRCVADRGVPESDLVDEETGHEVHAVQVMVASIQHQDGLWEDCVADARSHLPHLAIDLPTITVDG